MNIFGHFQEVRSANKITPIFFIILIVLEYKLI